MWTYAQGSGQLRHDDELAASGYSGFGEGRNNPGLEAVAGVGLIPRGFYTIGAMQWVDTPGPHGPYVLPLTPKNPAAMHGRDGFLIHGDSMPAPGTASHGCIILARLARQRIDASGDRELEVIA